MLMPLIMSNYATNLSFAGAGAMMGVNQDRMALANGVTGSESPATMASLGAMDKAFELQGAQAKTNYEVAQVMQQAAAKMKEKNLEHRRTMLENGVIFG
jgi:pyrroline-5-carboxylate reductase